MKRKKKEQEDKEREKRKSVVKKRAGECALHPSDSKSPLMCR